MDIRQFITKLTPKGWAMIGGSAAAAIVFLVVIMHFASAPSYSTLLTGLDPAQTGKITTTLSGKGIAYQIQNGGTALAVDSSQTSEARIALASAGLLGVGSQQPGFELLNSSQLGASDFQQQVTYQRALEGQLDQTIEQIQGIDSATVNLVLPNQQEQLFSDSSQTSSASVLLSDSGNLDPNAVKGIAELVASSVQGLSHSKVTITDSTGALLWPASGTDASGAPTSQQAADQQYDATTAAAATALLAQTLGPGKAQVVVNGNVNANQATSDTLTYGKNGVPLTNQTQTETLKGGSPTASGTTGTIPAYAATTGSSNSNYSNKTANTTYGVDKTVTHAVIAPGAVDQPDRVGAGRQVGPGVGDPGDQGRRGRRRRPERQARRHAVGPTDRVRQARRHARPGLDHEDDRLRQVRADRVRSTAVHVLHATEHPPAREGDVHRPAHLAAGARDPSPARRARGWR